jgi:hypothetical protein
MLVWETMAIDLLNRTKQTNKLCGRSAEFNLKLTYGLSQFSPLCGTSLSCGWRKKLPDMNCRWKYIILGLDRGEGSRGGLCAPLLRMKHRDFPCGLIDRSWEQRSITTVVTCIGEQRQAPREDTLRQSPLESSIAKPSASILQMRCEFWISQCR